MKIYFMQKLGNMLEIVKKKTRKNEGNELKLFIFWRHSDGYAVK